MTTQIYLIAPTDADPAVFPAALASALDAGPIAAVLLPWGARASGEYETLVRAVLPAAHAHDCAVLLEGRPDLVRPLGADGVHISGGQRAFEEAASVLKPEFIVGAGALDSRHEAMLRAEAGADYVFFGPLSGPTSQEARQLAAWWAETFETPCVLSEAAAAGPVDALGCEFLALGPGLWSSPHGPAKAFAAVLGAWEAA